MRIRVSHQRCLTLVVVSCIVVRLLVMTALQSWNLGPRYGYRDGEIASAIAAGDGFSWPRNSSYYPTNGEPELTAWQAPVYPYIIAAVFHFLGIYSRSSALVLIIFQILLSALTCILLFQLGRRLFNANAGLLAGLMFAFYPSAVHFAVRTVEPVSLLIVLLLLFLLQVLQLDKNPSRGKAALAGGIFGIGLLTDPTIALFLPFALAWLLFSRRHEYGRRIAAIAMILMVAWLTISPRQIRDYMVFHQIFFIKSNFTRELFMGNYGSGEAGAEEPRQMTTLNEAQRGKLYRGKFLESVVENPGQFLRSTLRRVAQFWTMPPEDQAEKENSSGAAKQIVAFSYYAVFALGITGIGLTLLRGSAVHLLLMALLSLPVPYYLTWFTRFRYRFPVEPLLIIFAAYAVVRLSPRSAVTRNNAKGMEKHGHLRNS